MKIGNKDEPKIPDSGDTMIVMLESRRKAGREDKRERQEGCEEGGGRRDARRREGCWEASSFTPFLSLTLNLYSVCHCGQPEL